MPQHCIRCRVQAVEEKHGRQNDERGTAKYIPAANWAQGKNGAQKRDLHPNPNKPENNSGRIVCVSSSATHHSRRVPLRCPVLYHINGSKANNQTSH
jgi:hypothetical protein